MTLTGIGPIKLTLARDFPMFFFMQRTTLLSMMISANYELFGVKQMYL